MRFGIREAAHIIRHVTIFGLALVMKVSAAYAREGFSTVLSSAPPAVKAAWDKTFAILTDYPDIYDIGTASLVWKVQKNGEWQLYFLTANHVISSACTTKNVCPNTYLVQNLRGKMDNNRLTVRPLEEIYFDKVEIVDRSTNSDLALLRVTVELDEANMPSAIPIASSCQRSSSQELYTIGFPATEDRTDSADAAIPEKDQTEKRWSSGIFVGLFHDGEGDDRKLYDGTTVDTLKGNSGGPVLNASGEIVGVMIKMAPTKKNEFGYRGSEIPGKLNWHSLSVRCDFLPRLKAHFAAGEPEG